MYKVYFKCNPFLNSGSYFQNTFFGGASQVGNTFHVSTTLRLPLAAALKLPTNVVDINSSEMGRFSPLRVRDISAPVINSFYEKHQNLIDITVQADPHVNKYDCKGAVSLSSSMQSNVPCPFNGNHTHLNMPGSQWGQGYKYLSDHLHSAHYLNLRNEYRNINKVATSRIGIRGMSTQTAPLSAKEKLKKALTEYGSTVIVFHVGISLLSLGGCYLLVSSGIDFMAILKSFNIGEGALKKVIASNAGTFVVAYAVHKIFAPVRVGITLTATPFIVKYLRKIGFLKKPRGLGGGKLNN